ncbi:hypothetical protein J1605_020512 [Eschrichtius robustus]|uniref:Calponin-homology (CH) domain-containing protein n=1 Tax=Eschrichtius robustus TaxID=9764 RepID=A0AB34HLW3_ESCRO|nr:hypothetical protein J1605_020512 [Eschrichtius robustus]
MSFLFSSMLPVFEARQQGSWKHVFISAPRTPIYHQLFWPMALSDLQEEGKNAINLPMSPASVEIHPEDTLLGIIEENQERTVIDPTSRDDPRFKELVKVRTHGFKAFKLFLEREGRRSEETLKSGHVGPSGRTCGSSLGAGAPALGSRQVLQRLDVWGPSRPEDGRLVPESQGSKASPGRWLWAPSGPWRLRVSPHWSLEPGLAELTFERRPAGWYLGRQQVQRPPGMPVLAGVKASDGVGGGQRGWSLDSKNEGDQSAHGHSSHPLPPPLLAQVLIDWVNDVLVEERIIVKQLEEDLYDGQVLQKLLGECTGRAATPRGGPGLDHKILYMATSVAQKLADCKLNVAEVTQSEIGQKQKLQTVLEAVQELLRPHGRALPWTVDSIHGKNLVATLHLLVALAMHFRAPIRLPEHVSVQVVVVRLQGVEEYFGSGDVSPETSHSCQLSEGRRAGAGGLGQVPATKGSPVWSPAVHPLSIAQKREGLLHSNHVTEELTTTTEPTGGGWRRDAEPGTGGLGQPARPVREREEGGVGESGDDDGSVWPRGLLVTQTRGSFRWPFSHSSLRGPQSPTALPRLRSDPITSLRGAGTLMVPRVGSSAPLNLLTAPSLPEPRLKRRGSRVKPSSDPGAVSTSPGSGASESRPVTRKKEVAGISNDQGLPLSLRVVCERDAFDTLFDHAPDKLSVVKKSLITFVNKHLNKLNLEVTELETQGTHDNPESWELASSPRSVVCFSPRSGTPPQNAQFADGVYLVLLMGLLEDYFVPLHNFYLTPDSFDQKVFPTTSWVVAFPRCTDLSPLQAGPSARAPRHLIQMWPDSGDTCRETVTEHSRAETARRWESLQQRQETEAQ